MSSIRILGVDPGQAGGLAIVHGGRLVKGTRMPVVELRGKKQVDARAVVEWWSDCLVPFDVAVIEAVHAMPKQGVSSSFQFGRMLGGIEALVFSVGKPVHYVTPASWKKAMGLIQRQAGQHRRSQDPVWQRRRLDDHVQGRRRHR
jgi:crossover junction endodeoxyribonuclease RuvC